MRNLMMKLWADDAGIVALEYLLVATIIGLGLVVGLAAVEGALDSELTELANAIQAIDQSFSFAGQSSCLARKNGSGASDICSSTTLGTFAAVICPVNVGNCK